MIFNEAILLYAFALAVLIAGLVVTFFIVKKIQSKKVKLVQCGVVNCYICGKLVDVTDPRTRSGLDGIGHEACVLREIKQIVPNELRKRGEDTLES